MSALLNYLAGAVNLISVSIPEPLTWSAVRDFFAHHKAFWSWIGVVVGAVTIVVAKGYPFVSAFFEFAKTVREEEKAKLEVKKTGLEVKRLQEDQSLVKPATYEEQKQYDPVLVKILAQAAKEGGHYASGPIDWGSKGDLYLKIVIFLLMYLITTALEKVKDLFSKLFHHS